jgi:peptide methionine sulfoxide reductase MsrA
MINNYKQKCKPRVDDDECAVQKAKQTQKKKKVVDAGIVDIFSARKERKKKVKHSKKKWSMQEKKKQIRNTILMRKTFIMNNYPHHSFV